MKNLVSTEKMLKHWLKKKVTITTATVVGFLLMGTAAFGETIMTEPKPDEIGTKVEIKANETYGIGLSYSNKSKDEQDRKITLVENNGIIEIKDEKNLKDNKTTAIFLQEENNGEIKTLINNGEINIIHSGNNTIFGAQLLGNVKILNNTNSKIYINSTVNDRLYAPKGVYAKISSDYKNSEGYLVENRGEIKVDVQVNGDQKLVDVTSAIRIGNDFVRPYSLEKSVSILNEGNLVVNANEKSNVGVVYLGTDKLNFENKGIITLNGGDNDSVAIVAAKDSVIKNTGTIEITSNGKVVKGTSKNTKFVGEVINTGVIKITDKTAEELKNLDTNSLFVNIGEDELKDNGMLVDKNGVAVGKEGEVVVDREISSNDLNNKGKDEGKIILTQNATIKGGTETINVGALEIRGNVSIHETKIEDTTINLDVNGKLSIEKDKTLSIKGNNINKTEKDVAITLGENSTLYLDGVTVGANLGEGNKGNLYTLGNTTINGDITVAKVEVSEGKTTFNGEISAPTINIGKSVQPLKVTENGKETEGYFTSNSKFTKETIVDATNGVFTIAVAEDKSNVLANSTVNATVKGNVDFDYSSLTENTTVALGNDKVNHDLKEAKVLNNKDSIYNVTIDDNTDTAKFEYNKKLLSDFGSELNAVNTGFQVINDVVSQAAKTTKERAELADKFYSSNIYSETVKAAYDNVKMNEEAVELLARKSEIGKWTAEGKALYSKNEYDRKGIVGDYSSEIESTGLMAAYGYGINETTTAGIAFSGVKQDVDTATGSADADLFYLGVYGNKVVGNYDFTAGLGYQFGKYEADNNILAGTGDKYDSQTVSGYVQGRYTADLGDGLSVQPKVKLGYTYVKQDDAKDSYFGVEDAEVSTFDAEAGFDVVKSVQLEKSKVDVKFGASYIRTMGDTDEEFTGRFYGAKASEGFNVLGAELAENVVKFNLGAEVTNENGFFYNGGLTYEFGSNDTEAYGVNVGAGYKF